MNISICHCVECAICVEYIISTLRKVRRFFFACREHLQRMVQIPDAHISPTAFQDGQLERSPYICCKTLLFEHYNLNSWDSIQEYKIIWRNNKILGMLAELTALKRFRHRHAEPTKYCVSTKESLKGRHGVINHIHTLNNNLHSLQNSEVKHA